MSDKQSWVNVKQLPLHTRLERVFSVYVESKRNWVGFTIHPSLKENPKFGYFVALDSKMVESPIDNAVSIPRTVIADFSEEIEDRPDLYIGGYANDEGEYFIELSEWFPCKDLAMDVAKMRLQDSIYSIASDEEVFV